MPISPAPVVLTSALLLISTPTAPLPVPRPVPLMAMSLVAVPLLMTVVSVSEIRTPMLSAPLVMPLWPMMSIFAAPVVRISAWPMMLTP